MTNTATPFQQVRRMLMLWLFLSAAISVFSQTIYQGLPGGSWNVATNWSNGLPAAGNNAEIFGGFSVVIDAPLTVDFTLSSFGNITLTAELINEGTFIADGGLIVNAGGSLVNRSELKTSGSTSFSAGSVFTNESGGTFTNSGPLVLETTLLNEGLITNNNSIDANAGTLQSEGSFQNNQQLTTANLTVGENSTFTNNSGASLIIFGPAGNFLLDGTVTNFGQITNEGNILVNGILNNNVTVSNSGTLTISAGGQVNNPGTFESDGDFINNGSFTNGFKFQNAGTASNHAQFFNNNQINNFGGATFTNEADALIQGGFGSLIDNAGDFSNLGNISTPGKVRNAGGSFENDGLLNLPTGSNLENGSDFINSGTINSNNVIGNGGFLNNFGTLNINAGCVLTNLGILNNFSPGKIVNSQDFENTAVGVFYNESMVINIVRMNLEGSTVNNGSFQNEGDIFILPGGEFTNEEALLQLAGNLVNEGTLLNDKYLLNDECSSVKNLGTIDNQDVIENKGIFIQRGILNGNPILVDGGYVHTSNSDAAPDICKDLTVSADVEGNVKVYTNSLIAFVNFDSCANIIYRGNGLGLNIFDCTDIGTVIPVEVSIKTRLNDELTCTAQVTPVDLLAPVFTGCPPNMSVMTDNEVVSVSWTPPTVLDNCTEAPSFTSDHSPGDLFPVGVTAVTYTSEDVYGNVNQCQFQINVVKTPPADPCEGDVTPPTVANCPENQTITTDFPFAAVSWTPPTFQDACQPLIEMVSKEPGSNFPAGTTTVVYTAKDGNNNVATCQFQIAVIQTDPCANDTEAPAFVSCPQNISLNKNPVLNGAVAVWTPPGATDNCNLQSITSNFHPGDIFPVGTTTVTYIATDASSNTGTCTFIVNVGADPCPGDLSPPVFSGCPSNISLITTTASAIANWTPPTAADACQPVSLFSNRQPGTSFPVGTTQVVYTASDAKGNTSTCIFNVTVTNVCLSDATPPVISNCPANVMAGTAGTSAPATWSVPSATDNCTLASFTSSYLPGAVFPLGETTVTYTARDANGNQSTCVFTVKVVDNTPPTALCKNILVFLDANGNGSITANDIDAGSFDANGITSLSVNKSSFNCGQSGNNFVTLTVHDLFNNLATCTAIVTVVDVMPPTISCPSNIVVCEGEKVEYAGVIASDNCGFSLYQTDGTGLTSGSIFPVGTTLQQFTAIDGNANASTCSFNVQVLPAPSVTISNTPCTGFCQGVVVLTANAAGGATFLWSNGQTTQPIQAAPGNYQVTVTNGNGCQKTASITVEPIDASKTAAYTILAKEEIHMHKNTVWTGGMGVWKDGKEAKVHDNSTVKSFVQAPKADIESDCVVNQVFLKNAPDPTLILAHKKNPMPASKDTVIAEGVTAHIYGNDFEKVEIKKGATAIFHAATDIMVKEFKTKDADPGNITKVVFLNPVDVIVKKRVEIGKYSIVNQNGPRVTFHLTEDNAELKEAVIFHANIYAPEKDIKIDDAKENYHTEMVGLFIAKKVDSKKYVDWYQNAPAPQPQPLLAAPENLVFNAYQEPEGLRVKLDWVTNTEFKNETFEVEKSTDGVNFEPFLEVGSTGHDDQPEIYRNLDPAPLEGANFYRLKLNYTDGSHSYSPIQQVWIHLDPEDFHLFPNPASEYVSVYRKKYEGKVADIKITNDAGHTFQTYHFDELPGEPVRLVLPEMKSGIYFLTMKVKGHREVTRQLVIAKE